MSAGKVVNLSSAFAELNRYGQNGDHERALKTVNKILQLSPIDGKALHCKIVCLIQLSKFKEALGLFNNSQYVEVLSSLHFEKAYIQYRMNFPADALKTVDSAPELTTPLKELRAQILYRLEKYSECFTLYRDVVKNSNDDYEEERQTNMAAAYAYISEKESGSAPWTDSDLGRYEMLYNAACSEALNGKAAEAVSLLHRADTAAVQVVNDDGGGQEELMEETAIIKVQLAYCLQLQGKDKEAALLYHSVLKNKPSDPALVAIASNNLVVINKEINVFDSRKRMKAATQEGLEHKLTKRQRRWILFNQALLSVYSSQDELCKQLCARLVKEFNMEKEAILIEAASLSRAKSPQAVNVLLKHSELKLAAVHLLLSQGDNKAAIKILESKELRFKAGVISALVLLYNADNNRDAVTKLFEEAMVHLKGNKQGLDVEEAWRSRHGGKGGPTNGRALARLLVADPQGAMHLAEKLPPIKPSEDKIDVDALENSNWMMGAKVVKKSTQNKLEQSPGTPGTDMSKKKLANRKRKTRLPANVDLSVAPDPERWLPRYERAVFRKRRQRGPRTEIMKGSQGMTTGATDQYDMTKQTTIPGKSPRVVEKQTPPSEPSWQKNKQAQKKKRKGGKW